MYIRKSYLFQVPPAEFVLTSADTVSFIGHCMSESTSRIHHVLIALVVDT